ncbi:uncharacterized protein B0H18DRAFT_952519 [Fomitopsis serialis]|uniref:uncharacterized protein n=1 Tax=Fomitopsis serialis TaxID=139415 RepID=UPI002008E061|nr:uncharacterized protein B0H18DRAFT_952519 [Neoantrodia serialis]KAH9931838.1 hypothetical protein B0H18DRAFT_952519 [Neoantrodia serialis]
MPSTTSAWQSFFRRTTPPCRTSPGAPSTNSFSGDGYVFKDDATPENTSTSFSLRTHIPLDDTHRSSKTGRGRRAGARNGGVAVQRPVRSAHPAHAPSPTALAYLSGHAQAFSMDGMKPQGQLAKTLFPMASLPYVPSLPAYSRLFEANGDGKIDYSVPLPAYSLPASSGLFTDVFRNEPTCCFSWAQAPRAIPCWTTRKLRLQGTIVHSSRLDPPQ